MSAFLNVVRQGWISLLQAMGSPKPSQKHLRISETVPLGDKRFLALVQVDDERFLVGGAANSIAMLARLSEPVSLSPLLDRERPEGVCELQ